MGTIRYMRKDVIDYIEDKILHNVDVYMEAKVHNITDKRLLPKRELFDNISNYIRAFHKKRHDPRWICVSGLRGVGKSTLLAQLFIFVCDELRSTQAFKNLKKDLLFRTVLFFSVDELTQNFGISIFELLSTLEKWTQEKLDRKNPLFLFLDEVHYDSKWAATLKTLYDRNPNLFIACTGSSALLLGTKIDEVRRITFEELHPVNFTQYIQMSRPSVTLPKNLKHIQAESNNILWQSESGLDIYRALKKKSKLFQACVEDIVHPDPEIYSGHKTKKKIKEIVNEYLLFGSLPFTHQLMNINKIKAFEAVENSIERIINIDFGQQGNFRIPSVTVRQILYMLASSGDTTSLETFSATLSINKTTVTEILEALVNAGLLVRLYPRVRVHSRLRKSSKYLFIAPAIRAAVLHSFGGTSLVEKHRGQLLEDYTALYLHKEFASMTNMQLYYLSQKQSADFCLDFAHREIPLEVGFGFKDSVQIENSIKHIGDNKVPYGLVFCDRELDVENKTVFLPWEWLFIL